MEVEVTQLLIDCQINFKSEKELTEEQIEFLLKGMFPDTFKGKFEVIDEDNSWIDNQPTCSVLFDLETNIENFNIKHKVILNNV